MNVEIITPDQEGLLEENNSTPCAGLTSSAIPEAETSFQEENSDIGVSTNCIPTSTPSKTLKQTDNYHWFALRTTYGREQKAYDYLTAKGVTAFYPTIKVVKEINGQRKEIIQSRLPNIFFAYGTEEEMEKYVFDNVNLPFLRFYYRHRHEGSRITKTPLIVPDRQMESLRIICESEAKDILYVPEEVQKFREGALVKITEGKFKGVIGRVARYQGQQRVAVIIDGVLTMATAYLPKAFLEFIEEPDMDMGK